MMVELIEYDDQTNPGETIKAVQRLATQDKATSSSRPMAPASTSPPRRSLTATAIR